MCLLLTGKRLLPSSLIYGRCLLKRKKRNNQIPIKCTTWLFVNKHYLRKQKTLLFIKRLVLSMQCVQMCLFSFILAGKSQIVLISCLFLRSKLSATNVQLKNRCLPGVCWESIAEDIICIHFFSRSAMFSLLKTTSSQKQLFFFFSGGLLCNMSLYRTNKIWQNCF